MTLLLLIAADNTKVRTTLVVLFIWSAVPTLAIIFRIVYTLVVVVIAAAATVGVERSTGKQID